MTFLIIMFSYSRIVTWSRHGNYDLIWFDLIVGRVFTSPFRCRPSFFPKEGGMQMFRNSFSTNDAGSKLIRIQQWGISRLCYIESETSLINFVSEGNLAERRPWLQWWRWKYKRENKKVQPTATESIALRALAWYPEERLVVCPPSCVFSISTKHKQIALSPVPWKCGRIL